MSDENKKTPPHLPEPWQDKDGRPLTTKGLRARSRTWSKDVWERYAATLEYPQTEVLLRNFDRALKRQAKIQARGELWSPLQLEEMWVMLEEAISRLPKMQHEVLSLLFWERLSEAEIAEALGVRRSAVYTHKYRALKNISKFLAQNSPYIEGEEP